MDRAEFIRQLERLLQGIPQAERDAALRYYNDYFEDAGAENEQDVLEALGNPARVAENIKRGLAGNGYREEDLQKNRMDHPVIKYQNAGTQEQENAGQSSGQSDEKSQGKFREDASKFKKPGEMPTWQLVLCIIGAIFLIPILAGLVSALGSAVIGALVGWFSVILAIGLASFVLLVVLVVLIVVGCMCLIETPLVGVALMGGGLVCGGLGILFLMLTVALAGIVTPAIFSGLSSLCKYLASKFGRRAAA
ncbi:MAG: DUF1700 domain-containing protein [Muribaculum sp.]|nr:DUF1700 domain-containing protein [Muribaculum sp.]